MSALGQKRTFAPQNVSSTANGNAVYCFAGRGMAERFTRSRANSRPSIFHRPRLPDLAGLLCLQEIRFAHVARDKPLALRLLARELACAADCLGFFAGFAF